MRLTSFLEKKATLSVITKKSFLIELCLEKAAFCICENEGADQRFAFVFPA